MSTIPVKLRRKRALKLLKRASLLLTLTLAGLALWIYSEPFPQHLLQPEEASSRAIFDQKGRLLREILNGKEGRTRWVPLQEIDAQLVEATLQVEDKRFYDHVGLDFVAIGRSAWYNLQKQKIVTGASTITQQTVKMLMPRRERRSIRAKLMEAVWALRMEATLSKKEILEQYLNRAPYGNQTFGVEAATLHYFGKPASDLSLGEATLLSGLPQAPSLYNPRRSMKYAVERRLTVLDLMLERNLITPAEHKRSAYTTPTLRPRKGSVEAPHFTDYVLREVKARQGSVPPQIHTTLDLDLQRKIEGSLRQHLDQLDGKNAHQAAVVVLDTQSSRVLAWVGSRNYFDANHQGGNDGVTALRQPGSTLKPFVYAMHLENGGTPADVLTDLPTHFPTPDGVYIPQNFSRKHLGPVSLREALGNSLNIPAVQIAHELGADKVLEKLRLLGMDMLTEAPDHYGPGIALGTGEVNLLSLANAYATLGRLGQWQPLALTRTPPRNTPNHTSTRRVLSPEASFQILDILTDDSARQHSFGLHSALSLPYRVAVKTGTSTHFRDAWTVGVTPDYTVAVWTGNFTNEAMRRVSGSVGAAPLLRQTFQHLYPKASNRADVPWFTAPANLHKTRLCALSGQPATLACPHTKHEWLHDHQHGSTLTQGEGGTRQQGPSQCAFHQKTRIDPRNGLRASNACNHPSITAQTTYNLPPSFREWGHNHNLPLAPERFSPLCPAPTPEERRTQSPPAQSPQVQILHPVDRDNFLFVGHEANNRNTITLRASVPLYLQEEELTWFINGEPQARASAPFTHNWTPPHPGTWTVGLGLHAPLHEVEIQLSAP